MSRSDRDGYIKVLKENEQWDKSSPEDEINFGLPYDWGSAMHYAANAGDDGQIVFVATNPIYQQTMGNYVGPSFKDVKLMNLFYDCMCKNGANCSNNGYPHPRNCEICICPSGFGGPTCEELQMSTNGDIEKEVIMNVNFDLFYLPERQQTESNRERKRCDNILIYKCISC